MPIVIPVNAGQVVHSLTLAGDPEPMAVTYGIDLHLEAVSQDVVTALHDMFGDFIATFVADDYVCTATEMQVREAPDEPLSVYLATGNRAGGASSDPLPQNCAYLIQKRSAQAGRRGRGRLYLPGVVEGAVAANGVITDAQRTTVNAGLVAWLARFGGAGPTDAAADMVILHDSAIPNDPDLPPTLVTSLLCDPVIATQRRRLR